MKKIAKSDAESNNKKALNKKKTTTQEDDSIIFDLPEVKDIPGQENIRPPRMREMIDTTISSADEEGDGLLDDLNEEDFTDEATNVSPTEKRLLKQSDRVITEEMKDRRKMKLDNTDGVDKLNESANPEDFGEDLDMPDSDENEDDPSTEDEANNTFK
ncbi:MAG: hypothetical protein QM764_23900 [Chitinophagaceae bacterium]